MSRGGVWSESGPHPTDVLTPPGCLYKTGRAMVGDVSGGIVNDGPYSPGAPALRSTRDDRATVRWRNGQGTTQVVAETETWRVSIADEPTASTFSVIDGYDRLFMPIGGVPVELTGAGDAAPRTVAPLETTAFAGEWARRAGWRPPPGHSTSWCGAARPPRRCGSANRPDRRSHRAGGPRGSGDGTRVAAAARERRHRRVHEPLRDHHGHGTRPSLTGRPIAVRGAARSRSDARLAASRRHSGPLARPSAG